MSKRRPSRTARRTGKSKSRAPGLSRDFGSPGGQSVELLATQYQYLQDNFDDLFDAATTPQQKEDLRREYTLAQLNYTKALHAVIDAGNAHVTSLNQEISDGQRQIDQMPINEQNIANILTTITAVVRAATSLMALVAA